MTNVCRRRSKPGSMKNQMRFLNDRLFDLIEARWKWIIITNFVRSNFSNELGSTSQFWHPTMHSLSIRSSFNTYFFMSIIVTFSPPRPCFHSFSIPLCNWMQSFACSHDESVKLTHTLSDALNESVLNLEFQSNLNRIRWTFFGETVISFIITIELFFDPA